MEKQFIYHSNLKNFFYEDTFLDWINIYYEKTLLKKDLINPDLLFEELLKENHNSFFSIFLKKIESKILIHTINTSENIRYKISMTLDSMYLGKPIIIGGAIYSNKHSFIGYPDIMIRSDYFNIIYNDYNVKDTKWYYIILNIWSVKIDINSKNKILDKTKHISYLKSKNIMEMLSLNEIQNRNDKESFIISSNIKIGIIDIIKNEKKNYTKTLRALLWIKDLYKNGYKWIEQINNLEIFKKELFPNMVNKVDFPWKEAKKQIAISIKEISLLYLCGPSHRNKAIEKNIYMWNKCNPDILGIKNENQKKIISNMIYINNNNLDISILPFTIKNKNNIYNLKENKVEFYVDFETFIDFNYTSSNILFMIGCLVNYKNEVIFKQFVCNTIEDELSIFKEWIEFMKSYTQELYIYHWSSAEKTIVKQIINKYSLHFSENIIWIDLLLIFKTEPIIIKNVFDFSLKTIVRELFNLGKISSKWNQSSVMDGKNAMIYAWHYYHKTIIKNNIFDEIKKYNYIDCQVLYEINIFLRKHMLS